MSQRQCRQAAGCNIRSTDRATINGNGRSNELVGTNGGDLIRGFGGNDEIEGRRGNDSLYGGNGNDEIDGNSGRDYLFGGSGRDELDGGAGNDGLYGGTGSDALDGGSGNDRLFGGAGNDELEGGTGNDRLRGGEGNDRFVFDDDDAGNDRIVDFSFGEDRIDLDDFDGLGFQQLIAGAEQVGDDVLFTFAPDHTVLVDNTTVSQFASGDFLF